MAGFESWGGDNDKWHITQEYEYASNTYYAGSGRNNSFDSGGGGGSRGDEPPSFFRRFINSIFRTIPNSVEQIEETNTNRAIYVHGMKKAIDVGKAYHQVLSTLATIPFGGPITGVGNMVPKGNLANHLFKGVGKLADTPTNRILIHNISNGKALGVDTFGKSWYTGVDAAGKSTYAQNGIVKGRVIPICPLRR